MTQPFLGQITLYPYNFPPKGWAVCAGQLLPISQNTALFSLLGTQFGGNGTSNFALPNLQGNVPIGQGQQPGGATYSMGEAGGETAVTLSTATVPPHTHTFNSTSQTATASAPAAGLTLAGGSEPGQHGRPGTPVPNLAASGSGSPGTTTPLAPAALTPYSGGSGPHNNMQPTLTLTWCIAMSGVYPARS